MFAVESQNLLFQVWMTNLKPFYIQYAHATGIDGVKSDLYIFVLFNTKEFRIMAASIGSHFHVFKLVLKLI
jgi:hypothetical protein